MIDAAVDIVKNHLDENYPDGKFDIVIFGKEYDFYSNEFWNVKIVMLMLADNEILFDIHNSVRKKKILEKQLRLIGAMKYSEKWI